MLIYEFPLVEKVRTLLRLEDLFDKALHYLKGEVRSDHDVVLMTLFQIIEVAGRADLKVDLLQVLERLRQVAAAARDAGFPPVAGGAELGDIESASMDLKAVTGRMGQEIRGNEWLMTVKGRAAIPGGACEFDLPSYHYWLGQTAEARRFDLDSWLNPMLPLHRAIKLVLAALRSTGTPETQLARGGNFQWMLGGRAFQLARLEVATGQPFIPELSANRYALMIRFLAPSAGMRLRQSEAETPFRLTLCTL